MNEFYDDPDELAAPLRQEIDPADRDLLELAARALGAAFEVVDGQGYGNLYFPDGYIMTAWNPLEFSRDAFDLGTDLELDIMYRVGGGKRVEVMAAGGPLIQEFYEGNPGAASRRAVTRAAAEEAKKAR